MRKIVDHRNTVDIQNDTAFFDKVYTRKIVDCLNIAINAILGTSQKVNMIIMLTFLYKEKRSEGAKLTKGLRR